MARMLRGAGQVGVGVSGACEAVVRTVQALAEEVEQDEEKSFVIMQDDLKNFYNEVSQLAIRDVIMQRVPALARLAKYLCEGPDHATVFYGLFHPMVKSVGVHMGSTLAAAFSAVVLAHHVEEWQRRWAEEQARAGAMCNQLRGLGAEQAHGAEESEAYDPFGELVFSQEDSAGMEREAREGEALTPTRAAAVEGVVERAGAGPEEASEAGAIGEDVYFEPQEGNYCGLHAGNMMLGGPRMTQRDMRRAAESVLQELQARGQGGVVSRDSLISENGDYDVEVVRVAIRAQSGITLERLRPADAVALVSRPEWVLDNFRALVHNGRYHFVAVRGRKGQLLWLDPREGPKKISFGQFVRLIQREDVTMLIPAAAAAGTGAVQVGAAAAEARVAPAALDATAANSARREQAASVMSDATAVAADAGRRGADGSAVAGRSAGVKLLVNYIDDGARVALWDATMSYLKYMFKHARRDGIFFQPEKSRFFVAERGRQTARHFVECVVAQPWWPLAGATREQFACQVKPLTRETRIDILGAAVAVDEAERTGFLAEKAAKAVQRIDQVCAHLGGPLSKQLLYALLAKSLGVQRVGHLLRSMDVEGPALEALMPLQRRIEQVLLQHLLPSGFDASAPTTLPELARAVAALPVRSGVGAGLQDMRRVAPCAAWAAQNESCELQAELRRKPVGGDDVAEARERVLMLLPELLRKQAGGLKHEWHVAAAEARVQKLCGRDEAAGLSQARLAHEVERFQRMRVAELVEETAKELQERGGAEQGDTVNMWCVSAMEKAAAGCSPLGIPRAGSAPEGYRFPDKEFEVLMAMWMGLPVGVRRPCPTAQCRQQADIWGVHGGMTCGGASEGHAVRSAMARRHNELAKQLWAALRTGGIPAMLEQQGWDGSKKRPGDVTCDSEPLGLPGRRTIFDTTVVAMQAPTRLATVVKALGTQITGRPWAWVDGKGDVRQAVDAAAAGARERKLRLYTDMTVEKVGDGPDIVRPAGVLMPDEKLFVVAVSALGALGPKVEALIDAIAECWFQRGAASSVGMARISICRSWRWSLWKSCVGAVATRMRAAEVVGCASRWGKQRLNCPEYGYAWAAGRRLRSGRWAVLTVVFGTQAVIFNLVAINNC